MQGWNSDLGIVEGLLVNADVWAVDYRPVGRYMARRGHGGDQQ